MPVFICSGQYTHIMHKNEVKLLLFVSYNSRIWNKKRVDKVSTHSAVPMTSSALNVVRVDRALFTSKFLSGNSGDEFDQPISDQT